MSQFNYFAPHNFSIFASYYTETLLYSNSRNKGHVKKRVLQYYM